MVKFDSFFVDQVRKKESLLPDARDDKHAARDQHTYDESHFTISAMQLLGFESTTGPPDLGQ